MVHFLKQNRLKWDHKSQELIFGVYCENTKGYRLIDPNSKKAVISRDLIFIENSIDNVIQKPNVKPQLITLPLSSS